MKDIKISELKDIIEDTEVELYNFILDKCKKFKEDTGVELNSIDITFIKPPSIVYDYDTEGKSSILPNNLVRDVKCAVDLKI